MKIGQLIPYPLPSLTYAASGNATVPLRDLPKQHLGRLAHLAGITFDVQATPTLTTAPTVVGQNAIVSRCDIFDGSQNRFVGGFNALRFKERIENGGQLVPEPDTNTGTGNAIAFGRHWTAGPPRMAGGLRDWVIPCGMLENGEVRVTFGALTDFSADTTALTCTIQVIAWIVLLDELNIPPFYEFQSFTVNAADNNLTGRALYAFLALGDSASLGAIAAGDFGAITVDTGQGQLVPTVDAEALGRMYQALFACGMVGGLQGEPRAAGDDNPKIVNAGTPTAVAAQAADLQMVVAAPPGCSISRLNGLAESVLRLRWNGTQASGQVFTGRILEQPKTVIAAHAAKALGKLTLKDKSVKVKTLSKDLYRGPRPEFMPVTIKVA